MEGLEEGGPSANNLHVSHCVVKGSYNKVFMAGESSNISVNVFREKEQEEISNRDSGYDDDPYPMDSAANDQEVNSNDQCENDDPVPMEMEERLASSCLVKGSENMVIMSGDNSTVKVNASDSRAEDNIPEENRDHGDINANNNKINSNPCPVQEVNLNSLPNLNSQSKAKFLDDGTDVGERPVAHVQPVPRQKQDNQEMPSNPSLHSSNNNLTSSEFEAQNMSVSQEISQSASGHSRSRPTEESLQMNTDLPAACSKRRMDDEENMEQLYKKQKVTAPQECAGRSCHRVNIEGTNNTAITAGSGSIINLNYYQCKHAQEEKTEKDDYSIDHIDGEVLKKTGMMSFFERISKHMGSTPNVWKRLARELPMVGYESLEREIKVLERKQLTTEQKAFIVLVKWWKGNSGAEAMKRALVVALRQIKLPWLANSLEKEIESFA